ncbi:MarR family winged helix-turn-helix transcriptional regulator [Solimicrobium silvestre]|uniref:Transcriptional regulator n=1 Tax=Solimicrobium silvestre TaxID=2099400 RepID=A0A2S9H554_9BURK|nr:MarR family transcriptional regulator [Solimicrobium silvestre]PRC95120.1 Transcriptional regulator [Solimicrobium silvestre]
MSNTESPSAALDFCLRLTRATTTINRRLDNALGNLHGLSFSDFTLLLNLSRAPGERMRRVDLAERLGLTVSGITRALIPLEKIGLVTRQSDERDARVGYAVLSKTGKKLLAHALISAEAISQEAVQTASPEQLDAFSLVLGQLAGMNLTNS